MTTTYRSVNLNSKDDMALRIAELERELAAAQEKLDYAKHHGLHIGRMVTADRPEGFLAHEYVKGSTLARMFDEWSASIGLDSQLVEAREDLRQAEESRETNAKLLDRAIIERNEARASATLWESRYNEMVVTCAECGKQRDEWFEAMKLQTKKLGDMREQRDALATYAQRAKDAAEDLDWNDHNSVFNYATHRKTDAINSLATLEGGGE